jgi:glycerol kinase
MASYILAVDQGTTGTRTLVVDTHLGVHARVIQEFRQIFPKPGWVEHDLEAIWGATVQTIQKAMREAGVRGGEVAAIGIANQRETVALWDRRSGKPIHNAVVWQDRRTAEACERLQAAGHGPVVREKTGLVIDPYFSATKIAWLLDNVRGARAKAEQGALAFGTIDSYLLWRFTGGATHATDAANASRTSLMDLHKLRWDDDLLQIFGVPRAILPEIRSNAEIFGTTRGVRGLPDGIPIAGMAGDQQAALFGQACYAPGEGKCTYGTGAFLLQNTGSTPVASQHGLISTVAWKLGSEVTYALEGSSFVAGAVVQWLRDGLKFFQKTADVEPLAKSVRSSGDVVFVPALAGLGAPHWRPNARGLIAGLDRSTTAGHIARAALEGIAFQIYDLAQEMRVEGGQPFPVFRVDGGASQNDLLMQFQADLLDVPVERPRMVETTAMGAALLAGLGAGFWKSPQEIRKVWKSGKRFEPRMTAADREGHLKKWRKAVQAA